MRARFAVGCRVSSFTVDSAGLGELANLYQILAYRITSPLLINAVNDDVKDSANGAEWRYDPKAGGMPVGPASNSPSVNVDEGRWTYERAIPVFRLFGAGGQVDLSADPAHAKLPSSDANPYAGVGKQVSLEFRWRDVYGHELPTTSTLNLDVRYFDPLVGIHLWPSTKATYVFTTGTNGGVQLTIHLRFDPSPFQSGETDATVRALDTYRTAFYQVHQSDVTFQVRSSQTNGGEGSGRDEDSEVRPAGLSLPCRTKEVPDSRRSIPDETLTVDFASGDVATPAGLVTAVTVQVDITRRLRLG